MAIKNLKILDMFNLSYDDTKSPIAITTDGVIKVQKAPVADEDVARKSDIAPVLGTFLTVITETSLSQARRLLKGNGLTFVDNGAGSTFEIKVAEAEIDHDSLLNFLATEHRAWENSITQDIHMANISEVSVVQHEQALDTYPRRVRQADIPTPAVGELLLWSDLNDNSVRLVYNDVNAGVVSIQLT